MSYCKTCELVARRDAGDAPFWDNILRTGNWDLVHNYSTTLPGWLVLVTRRHIAALDEMSEAEAVELGPLIQKTSAALKSAVGCEKTYAIQFAEKAEHPHVHFHIVPRMADIPAEYRGRNVFNYRPKTAADQISEALMNEIAVKVKAFMASTN